MAIWWIALGLWLALRLEIAALVLLGVLISWVWRRWRLRQRKSVQEIMRHLFVSPS